MSNPPSTPTNVQTAIPILVSALRGHTDPATLRGALEAVLQSDLGSQVAREVALKIVDEAAFDTSEVLIEVSSAVLTQLVIPVGRHSRVLNAIFEAGSAQPQTPMSFSFMPAQPSAVAPPVINVAAPLPVINLAAPVVNVPAPIVNVSSPGPGRTFKTSWPSVSAVTLPTPELFLDFGLSLRGFLRQLPQLTAPHGEPVPMSPVLWSDLVFDRFLRPWDDIPVEHVHSGPLDKLLSVALMAAPGAIPPWAAPLIRQPLREDRALQALLILSRNIAVSGD